MIYVSNTISIIVYALCNVSIIVMTIDYGDYVYVSSSIIYVMTLCSLCTCNRLYRDGSDYILDI